MVAADGTGAQPLAPVSSSEGSPRWSPDGRSIAYAHQGLAFTIDARGGLPKRVTSGSRREQAPVYSRDGRWVYLGCESGGEIRICRAPSTGEAAVETGSHRGSFPQTSPDGNWICYTKPSTGAGSWGGPIWKAPVTGGEEVQTPLTALRWANFVVADEGVYFMPFDDPDQAAEIRLFDPHSGR